LTLNHLPSTTAMWCLRWSWPTEPHWMCRGREPKSTALTAIHYRTASCLCRVR